MKNLNRGLKSRDITSPAKICQSYAFSSMDVGVDHKEG